MVMMEASLAGNVSIDFSCARATCRDEPTTGTVFRWFSAALKLHSLFCWNRISATQRIRDGYRETISHYLDP
jgi:hypothetical protein